MIDDRHPLISIVIPSLNQRAFLADALESVLSQSYARRELIVVDGGSTDGSAEVLQRYAPRLAYWRAAADGGPAAALNHGASRAQGEILAFLNADDFLLPGALASVADAFAGGDADVVSGHGYFATPSGELALPAYSDRWNVTRFRYGACVLVQPATFVRRQAFERAGGFRDSGRVCWDMELWADLSARGARFATIDRFLAAFRLHQGSITGRADLRQVRRRHAREVMEEARGRPETPRDRALHVGFRVLKFAAHPVRSLRQRALARRVLHRWSI
jgi:glycosyltransferase involved in cell wall biosynthesis